MEGKLKAFYWSTLPGYHANKAMNPCSLHASSVFR